MNEYDVILNTNTQGPTRLLDFAKKCKRLKLFLHFSTVYVTGDREGIILEKPFCMAKSIAEEKITSEPSAFFVSSLDVNDEIKLADRVVESLRNDKVAQAQKMKDLGMERAKIYGWRNTYEMAKAMGEMLLIDSKRSETFSLVPVDMVVNAAIAAMAKHGVAEKSEIHVYHIGSSVENPVSLQRILNFFYDHFTTAPLLGSKEKKSGIAPMKLFGSVDSFSSYMRNEIVLQSWILRYISIFKWNATEDRNDLCNWLNYPSHFCSIKEGSPENPNIAGKPNSNFQM
ncbi:unnamed protein product [Dovyalis caffra]|uniref:Fatty acyl-CoA reductase n=1 Tax=Dovyalis caffra TaxID=77055 RepID=A0AAV1R9I4_9ROSI|nr:unnamed protein product [Dovyalis caffra]